MTRPLGELRQKIERLASQELQRRAATKIAEAMHRECLKGFNEQRDPYGNAWAPLKNAGLNRIFMANFTHKILQKTGKGVESLRPVAIAGRALLRIKDYMKFAQYGSTSRSGRKIDARRIFPDPARGLGLWASAIALACHDTVAEMVH